MLLKLSPMLDVTAALRDIPQTKEVHVVSVDGECKELLLTVTGGEASTPTMHAVMLSASACDGQPVSLLSFTSEEEREAAVTYADSIGAWLYEPDAAVLKAGAVRLAGVRFGIDKLAPMSHLYTSDRYLPDWPGKSFKVERVFTFSRSDLRALKASTPRADLSTRGFPQAVAQLRARLGLKEGGDAHLFATTLADGRKVIIKT